MIWHHIKRKNTSIHNMVIYAIKNNYGFFFMKSEFFIDTLARRLIHYPYKVMVHWTMLMKQSTGAQRWKQVFRDITTRTKERLWIDLIFGCFLIHFMIYWNFSASQYFCWQRLIICTLQHYLLLFMNLILIYIYRL